MRSLWSDKRNYSKMPKASNTSGVQPVSLQGRLYRERERLTSMSEEERCWRAQWVSDQALCPHEPVYSKDLYKELHHPIRRLYRLPMDLVQAGLSMVMTKQTSHLVRSVTSTLLISIGFLYGGAYYFKYNSNDWTRKGGLRVLHNRPTLYPYEDGYPSKYDRENPSDYGSRGFNNSPL